MSWYMPATLAVPCPECAAEPELRCYNSRSGSYDRKEPHKIRGRAERLALAALPKPPKPPRPKRHQIRASRGGIPRPTPRPLPERIRENVEIDEDGCWLWTGATNRGGYGKITVPGRQKRTVHRVSYETFVGPIPDGLVIDHTCHTVDNCAGGKTCKHRRCANPDHLAVVTQGDNIRRGHTGGRIGPVDCPDHVLVLRPNGKRTCSACNSRRHREWKARQQAA